MTENDSNVILEYAQQQCPDFPISQKDLEYPTFDFVIEFYQLFQTSMLDYLDRMVKYEEGNPQEVSAPICTTNPNIMFSKLGSFINDCLKKMYCQLEVECTLTLTLTDIYEPTAKRTQLRFKLLLILLMYYDSKVDEFNSVVTKELATITNYNEKLREKETVRNKLGKEAEQLAYLDDQAQKLQKEGEKLDQYYDELQEQKDSYERKNKTIKRQLEVFVNTYENKVTLVANLKTNIQQLDEQVVSEDSYKSLLDLEKNLINRHSALEAQVNDTVANLHGRSPDLEKYNNVSKQLDELNAYIEELEELQHSCLTKNTQLQTIQQNRVQKNTEILKLNESQLSFSKSVETGNKAEQSAKLAHSQELEQIKQLREQLKVDLAKENVVLEKIMCDSDGLTKIIVALKNECKELVLENHNLKVVNDKTYKNMLSSEAAVTKNFLKTLDNIAQQTMK